MSIGLPRRSFRSRRSCSLLLARTEIEGVDYHEWNDAYDVTI